MVLKVAKKDTKEKEVPFEQAIEQLEEIVKKLESGDTPLDDSLKLFEQGTALSELCNRRLSEAEQHIQKIMSVRLDRSNGEN